MKRLLLLCGLLGLFATGTASASTTLYSLSGSATYGSPLVGTFTNTAVQDLTVTATFQGKRNGTYELSLVHFATPYYEDQRCFTYQTGAASTLTCTVSAAQVGDWQVKFQPTSGNTYATLIVTAA